MEAPTLREDDVLVRALGDVDVPDLVVLGSDAAVSRWVDVPDPFSADDARALVARAAAGWARGDRLELAVERGDRCAGVVSLTLDGQGAGDLCFALLPGARGCRTASASVRLLLTWAFLELGLSVVHWRAQPGNWAARRVVWACGFTVEGTVRDLLVARGERRDAWVASLRWDDPLEPRSRWLDPVPLTGGRVRLGPHTPDDVQRIAEACGAPSTQAWLPHLPAPYTVLDAVGYLDRRAGYQASGSGVFWAVRGCRADAGADSSGGPLLAEVGLFGLGGDAVSGEIGYWCHPDARGRGATTEAVRLVARCALTPAASGGFGLARVVLKVARGNTASVRVAEKVGFTPCGVERFAEQLRDGTRTDFLLYDLLAEELDPAPPHPTRDAGAMTHPSGSSDHVGSSTPSDRTGFEGTDPDGIPIGGGEVALRRVSVVVDLPAPGDEVLAEAVANGLPLEQLPAMAGPGALDGAVRLSSDGTALEVVLLVESATEQQAADDAVAATERALAAADLTGAARPGQVRVHDAYAP